MDEGPETALALRRRHLRQALRERVNLWLEGHLARGEVLPGGRVARRHSHRVVDHGGEDGCGGGAEPGSRY